MNGAPVVAGRAATTTAPPCVGCAAAGAWTSRRNGCRLVFEIDDRQGGAENR